MASQRVRRAPPPNQPLRKDPREVQHTAKKLLNLTLTLTLTVARNAKKLQQKKKERAQAPIRDKPSILEGHAGPVTSLSLCHRGAILSLISSSGDKSIRIWELDGRGGAKAFGDSILGHTARVNVVRTRQIGEHGDDCEIASVSDDFTGRLWDQDGVCLAVMEGHTARVTC